MYEIEMKFSGADWAPIRATLAQLSAQEHPVRKDVDHYFNAPDRDFAKTDEVVRIRRIGNANLLTYKGPKLDRAVKTRTEIELPLADGQNPAADAVRFLTSLGYRPVAVVTKTRQVYSLERQGFRIEVCFDDVGAVGKYVEVEIMSQPEQAEQARLVVQQFAAELGLTNLERRSYLRLLLELPPKKL